MLSKARRQFRGKSESDASSAEYREKAQGFLRKAQENFAAEVAWRGRAARELAPGLMAYDQAIADNIGLRLQERLSVEQAESVANCQSHHRDLTLNF